MVKNATVAGVPSWTPLGELTNSPDDGSPSWNNGREGREKGGRKGKGGVEEG